MTKLLLFLCVVLVYGFPDRSFAQLKYQISNYSVEYYQGGNQNWDIAVDSDYTVYFANNAGLLVIKNSATEVFGLPEQTIVRSVAIVRDTVFTGSFEEFGYWIKDKNEDYIYHSLKPKLVEPMSRNDEIWQIVEHKGLVYFHSFGSLYIYDGKKVERFSDGGSSFMFLYPVGEDLYSQRIGGGLVRINGKNVESIAKTERLAHEELKTVLPLSSEQLLIATTENIYEFEPESGRFREWRSPLRKKLVDQQINTSTLTKDGFAIGTILGGIYIFNRSANLLSEINTESRLQNNTVLSLQSDAFGNVWAGLDKGIDYISFDSPIDDYRNDSPNIGSVYAAVLHGSSLYVGTNQGLFKYETAKSGQFILPKLIEKSQGQVWFLRVLDGLVYVGLNSGTYVLKQDELHQVSDITGAYNLKDYPKNASQKIQSTYNDLVLFEKQDGIWKKSALIDGFRDPVLFMEFDHLGSIWAGHTIKGIQVLQPNTPLDSIQESVQIGAEQGIHNPTNKVFAMDNRIFTSSADSLFVWDSLHEKFEPYTLLNELFTEPGTVSNIVHDGSDRYWIIKKNEVLLVKVRFNEATLLYRFLPKAYDFHFPEGYEQIIPLNDTIHLICLDDGFSILNLETALNQPNRQANIDISSIEIENDSGEKTKILVDANEQYVVDRGLNTITFRWTSSQPTGVFSYFQYKLDNHDTQWSSWSATTTVSFKSLAPGTYTFKVRSLSSGGKISESQAVQFSVKQAWYNTYVGYVLISIIVVLLFVISRIYISKRKWKLHGQILETEREKMRLEKELAQKELITLRNEKLESEIEHKTSKLAYNTMTLLSKNEALGKLKKEVQTLKSEVGGSVPAKYFNSLISMIDDNLEDETGMAEFESLYDQTHDNFFKRLKTEYPDLTPGDLRLCAYLRMNLASKEIAPLLNISVRGVEERRYRLRKRLNLSSNTNLTEMLMTF